MNNSNVKVLKLILKSIKVVEERSDKSIHEKDFELMPDSINFRIKIIGDCLLRIRNLSKSFFTEIEILIRSILNQTLIISNNYECVNFKISDKISIKDLPILKQKNQTFLSNNNGQAV